MAVKPGTVPRIWANLTNYDNGPFVGSPMKVVPSLAIANSGHRPGAADPTAAEHENSQQNKITDWITNWLFFGRAVAEVSAHPVETAADGRTQIEGVDIVNSQGDTALTVDTVTADPAVVITNVGAGGTGIDVTVQTAAATTPALNVSNVTGSGIVINPGVSNGTLVRGDLLGTGHGYQVSRSTGGATGDGLRSTMNSCGGSGAHVIMTNCLNTARGVFIEHTGADSAPGFELNYAGGTDGFPAARVATTGVAPGLSVSSTTGFAIGASNNSNLSPTISVTQSGQEAAISALNLKAAPGGSAIYAQAAGGVAAIHANGLFNTTPAALLENNGAATTVTIDNDGTGGGLRVNGGTLADAVEIFAGQGKGLIITAPLNYALHLTGDTSDPDFAAAFFAPQSGRPLTPEDGALCYSSTEKQFLVGDATSFTWLGLWGSSGGYCRGANISGAVTLAISPLWQTVVTATASGINAPKAVGFAWVRVTFGARLLAAGFDILGVQIIDVTNANLVVYGPKVGGGTGLNAGYRIEATTNEWCQTISFIANILVPAAGTRTYSLQLNAAAGIQVRYASLDFLGLP